MELPEEYNVLHIGPECESPMDRAIVRAAKKAKISSIAGFISMAVMFLGFGVLSFNFHGSISNNESQISSLIDEVGTVSQANFLISQQVISQEAILRSIEDEFTNLGKSIANGDDAGSQTALQNILAKLSSAGDSGVQLSEDGVTEAAEDSTFDVLILGTNGAHTDTIMVASVNAEKQKISLFSVPRDLYINGRKINEYYTYYGVEQLERMVGSVTGLHMDSYVQVDLESFVQIVDLLGGVDVYVEEDVYDSLYPNGQGGYMTYSIEKGQHHLDGKNALMYARSRESTSDFSRAERQQNVVSALRDKVLQLDGVMDLKELTGIFQTALGGTKTDIDVLNLVGYYYDYKDYDLNTGFVLTSGNYLYSLINEGGAYILLPKTGNFDAIHKVISDLVN